MTSASIQHVFVVMMENRSFDHLLAFSGLPGVAPPDPGLGMLPSALDRAPLDPPHEFEDVQEQIGGDPPMSGFKAQSYWEVSRRGFGPGALPMLSTLARQYFLFDNWYSSMPGPTWPNRFFVHAASSGGLDNSPSPATTVASETIDSLSFSFEHGTIFQRLTASGRSWRVYHDDLFPQVLAIQHMIDPFRLNTPEFSWLRRGGEEFFVNDLANGYDIDYTFIEPNYGLASIDFQSGNCQHPTGSIAAGEAFIQDVYETIRNSPVWPESLLIITYDEHGGFFDRQSPPPVTPPGDDNRNHDRAKNPQSFPFNRMGVRVPTVAISPWIAPGVGSQRFPGQTFDHTSIVSTVLGLFAEGVTITARDAAAPSFASICSLPQIRTDRADIPLTAAPPAAAEISAPVSPSEGMLNGFSRIAMSLDLSVADAQQTPHVALAHPSFSVAEAADTGPAVGVPGPPRLAPARSAQETLRYIQAVAERVRSAQANDP